MSFLSCTIGVSHISFTLSHTCLVEDRDEIFCHDWLVVKPSQIKTDISLADLGQEYPSLSGDQLAQLFQEYQSDQEQVQKNVESSRLDLFFEECVSDHQARLMEQEML